MTFLYAGQTNDTCDIYRFGNAPPSPPDVAGVKIYVIPRFTNIKGDFAGLFTYTHILLMPLGTDVRDNFGGGNADTLYLPNQNGLQWTVSFVGRRRVYGGQDYLEVYGNGPQSLPAGATEG